MERSRDMRRTRLVWQDQYCVANSPVTSGLMSQTPSVRVSSEAHPLPRSGHKALLQALAPPIAGWPGPSARKLGPVALPALPGFIATTSPSVPSPRIDTRLLTGPPLGVLSLHRGDRFPRSTQEPALCSRHLHAGHRSSSRQASLELVPSQRLELGFDRRPYAFDTSATVHLRSSSQRTPDGLVPPFPSRSPPRSLDRSSIRWFEPWSCNPSPRGQPSSLVQQSCVHSTLRSPFRAVVAHGRPPNRPVPTALLPRSGPYLSPYLSVTP